VAAADMEEDDEDDDEDAALVATEAMADSRV
jgi:hypothetical protein